MKVEFELVPGLEEKINHLFKETIGELDSEDTLAMRVSMLLPILIDNALAGDLIVSPSAEIEEPDLGDGSQPVAPEVDIAQAVADATSKVQDIDISRELVLHEDVAPPPPKPEEPELTFEALAGRVNERAYAWAKGHPLKEKALTVTVSSMPQDMWDWEKLLQLSQRTFDMRMGGDDEPRG